MNKNKELFKSKIGPIFKYSIIKYIALAFGFLKGIINADGLGPEMLGILGNLTLILGYCSYANLGVFSSMNREYVLYKDNDRDKAEGVINTTFTFVLLLSIIFLVIAIFIPIINKTTFSIYVSLIFVISIFEQFKSFFINYFRLIDEYIVINMIEVIYNIISLLLIVLLIGNFKIYGILFSMLVCGIMVFIYGLRKMVKIKIEFNKYILKDLLIIGIPLLIYNLGFYIYSTIDRWIIIKFLSNSDLGYYTFANSLANATLVFIESILFLIYPKAIKKFNENSNDNIVKDMGEYTRLLEIFGIILFSIGLIGITPFINIFLKQYTNSISVYLLLVFSVILLNLAYFYNVYIVSNGMQRYLVYIQFIALMVNYILNVTFVKMGFGIIGIALGTVIANCIYSMFQYIIFIKIKLGKFKIRDMVKLYYKIFIYLLSVILIIILKIPYKVYVFLNLAIVGILYYKEFKNLSKTINVLLKNN